MKKFILMATLLCGLFITSNAFAQNNADPCCPQPKVECPPDQPCPDTYQLYCHYEPCYYDDYRCVEEPQYYNKKCCRMVPKYYEVCKCKYVPQYYTETCCKEEPEYYDVCECKTCKKWVCDKKCKWVPKYYYKHECAPQPQCAPAQQCAPACR